jgi:YihY family inner membrane protein
MTGPLWVPDARVEKMKTAVFVEACQAFHKNGDLNLSASIAFYALLSIIPFLFLTVFLIGHIIATYGSTQANLTVFVQNVLPHYSDVILKEVGSITLSRGFYGWFGLLFMIWTASLMFASLEGTFGKIFNAQKHRSFLHSKLLAMAMIPLGGAFLTLSFLGTTVLEAISRFQSAWVGSTWLAFLLDSIGIRYFLPFAITALFLACIYWVIPYKRIFLRSAFLGGLLCALMWEGAKHIFATFVLPNPNYGLVYGSLKAFILFMMWVLLASAILLFCAEIAAANERFMKRP